MSHHVSCHERNGWEVRGDTRQETTLRASRSTRSEFWPPQIVSGIETLIGRVFLHSTLLIP